MKRLFSVILCITMLMGILPMQASASGDVELVQGDFIFFGTYQGRELVWYVCEAEDGNAVLFCVTPFLFGEFDASPNIYTRTSGMSQVKYGSSSWRTSDLRTFLNSGDESVNYVDSCFDYSDLPLGTGGSVDSSLNNSPSYSTEPGFLSLDNFIEHEIALLNVTTHATIVSYTEDSHLGYKSTPSIKDYGKNAELSDTLIDNGASYVVTKDYMYPLSSAEYYEYVRQYKGTDLYVENVWGDVAYWLRDSTKFYWNTGLQYLWVGMYQSYAGGESYYNTGYWNMHSPAFMFCYDSIAIRPSCRISTDYISSVSGEGTYEDPYRMEIDDEVLSRPEYTRGSIYAKHPENLTLAVYTNRSEPDEAANNVLQPDVKVTVGDTVYYTGPDGCVTVPYPRAGATFEYEGYYTRKIAGNKLEKCSAVFLQGESDKPVINALWVGNVDALHNELHLDLVNSGTQSISIELATPEDEIASVKLVQDTKSVTLNKDRSTRVTWIDHFDVSQKIYLVVKNNNGQTTTTPLNLKVDTYVTEEITKYSFSLGDKLSFFIGDNGGEFLQGSKISVDTYFPLKYEISIENGKLYCVFGPQIDIEEKGGVTSVKQVSNLIKDMRNNIKKGVKSYDDLSDIMTDGFLCSGTSEADFGVKGHFEFLGFMEGYVTANNEIVMLDSGILVSGGAEAEWSIPFAALAVPCFADLSTSGDISISVTSFMDKEMAQIKPNGTVKVDLSVSAGVGVGVKELASVSIGAKGTISNKWETYQDSPSQYTLTATVKPYVKGNILIFEYEPEFNDIYNEVIYSYPEQSYSKSVRALSAMEAEEIYDASEYRMADLSELDPIWMGKTRGISDVLVSGAYDNADPQLVTLPNGDLLLLYLSRNSESDNANCVQLYSTVYSGGSWSTPKLFYNDGTVDSSPNVVTAGDKTYVTWVNYGKMTADTTLEEAMETGTVTIAEVGSDATAYNVNSIDPISVAGGILSGDPVIHTMPSVSADIVPSVVWASNNKGDAFGVNGSYIYSFSSSESGDPFYMADMELGGNKTDGMVISLVSDTVGNESHYAMAVDTDGDLNTTDDIEIFVDGAQLTDNDVADTGLQYVNHVLYWYSDGKLIADGEEVFSCNGFNDRFLLIEDGNTKCVLFTKKGQFSNTLYAAWCHNDIWGEPVSLTDGTDYIADFTAAFNTDSTLSLVLTSYAVDEDADIPFGETSLRTMKIERETDIALTDVYYETFTYVENHDMVFDLTIENHGAVHAENVLIEILDSTGYVVADKVLGEAVLSGQSAKVSIGLPVLTAVQGQTYTLRVTAMDIDESNTENNTQTVELSWDDLSLEKLSWGNLEDGQAVIYANVVNRGYSVRESATVELRRNSAEGEIVATAAIDSLDSLGASGVSFTVAHEENAVYYVCVSDDDDNLGNNTDFVILAKENESVDTPDIPCDGGDGCPSAEFTDVNTSEWYHESIDYVLNNGLLKGVGGNRFEPNETMTRAMLVTVLWRYAGEPIEGTNRFTDVPEDIWYTAAVAWAAENGIVNGVSADRFDPDGSITREQMAAILYRYAEGLGIDTDKRADLSAFPDADEISDYAEDALSWANAEGLINGSANGGINYLLPQGNATRAQVSAILMRYIKNVA